MEHLNTQLVCSEIRNDICKISVQPSIHLYNVPQIWVGCPAIKCIVGEQRWWSTSSCSHIQQYIQRKIQMVCIVPYHIYQDKIFLPSLKNSFNDRMMNMYQVCLRVHNQADHACENIVLLILVWGIKNIVHHDQNHGSASYWLWE